MSQLPESDRLIERSEMVALAKRNNLSVTLSTIHRWANEPGFPTALGQTGKTLLYSQQQVTAYMKKRLRRLQEDR